MHEFEHDAILQWTVSSKFRVNSCPLDRARGAIVHPILTRAKGMTKSADVAAELSNCQKTKGERAPRDFFFIAAAPLVARGLRATVGRLSLSLVGIAPGFAERRGGGAGEGGGY